jgi:hypothetical protein
MFFADPIAAFANVHKAMKPGGRVALAIFRAPQENPFVMGPLGAVRHLLPSFTPPGPGQPGMFSLADPGHVHRILEGAGFRSVSLAPLDPVIRFAGPGCVIEASEVAMMVGQVSRALAGASAQLSARVRSELATFFRDHDGPQGITLPAALWVIQARA